MNLEQLKSDTLIIIPNNLKHQLLIKLNDLNKLYNIKLMSLEELITKLTFSFDEKSIYYLMKNYKVKYSIALEYLNSLKYIENKDYNNKKLNMLVNIKEDLIKNNLVIHDNLFYKYIENKEIIIYGYDYIDKHSLKILKNIKYEVVSKPNKKYCPKVYEFETIYDEVQFVANEICNLIKNGIPLQKIKISNINAEYKFYLETIFPMFNINFKFTESIYSTKICKEFLNLLKMNTVENSLKKIEEKFDLKNDNNSFIYNSIIEILNKYSFCLNDKLLVEILTEEFKRRKKKNFSTIEEIKIDNNIIDDQAYVFLIDFNQNVIPKIYKDEEFINDKEKELLGIENSCKKNEIEKEIIKGSILNIKNLIITYKIKSQKEIFYPSSIIDDLKLSPIKPKIEYLEHSNLINKINLSKNLDDYIKYGTKSSNLDLLFSNYSDIKYRKYNNKYTMVSNLNKYLNNNLCLSYSSMDNYYKCSFKYYLNNILKLNDYEEIFATIIGNLFHYVLSKCLNTNTNFEKEYNDYLKNKEFSYKEKFYLNKLKKELQFIINTIKKQYSFMSFNKSLYEEEICIEEGIYKNVKIIFKGIIDKLLYKEEKDKTYVIIIDYKTGNPKINLNNSKYGLNMQLPVYLYLAKNSNKIKNVKILGFYLQKILINNIMKEEDKTFESQKEDNLKLQGYTISDEKLMSLVDNSYENSRIIKNLKITKKGFSNYSKVITSENIEKLIDLTSEKIEEASKNIIDGKFDINPKIIDGKNISCKYCEFKDICFRNAKNEVKLKKEKDLSFLRGDINA